MERSTVFTKTAKGITQVNQKSASLSKDLMKVLKMIDGKSNFGEIMQKAEMDKGPAEIAVTKLIKEGYARIFETRKEEADPFAEGDDFDFTAPGKMATPPAGAKRVVGSAANDVTELVRQQKAAEAEKKAKEQAHEAARAKAKAEAEARARAEAEAKARAEAEQRAMELARKAKEAAERAKAELEAKMREEEARKRALAEQQARAATEQKRREEEEAKRLAEMRANAEREANERAKAELQAKVRAEEARRKTEAEAAARAAAEAKRKEDEEGRRLAELRAKAEVEAKALGEARAKAEAEAAALAKARAEAEAAAKRKAAEAVNAEKEMKERLKEEIESRIRAEMEELLRNEFEEKTRAEMEKEILEEARMAARAELEDRLREERATLAQAGEAARDKAEREARTAAEREAKLRAEAEARAKTEAEARAKAEEELRRAKIEAEARAQVEFEERERRERELQEAIELERKAKGEAEMRAKIEARARETVEADTRARVQAELETDMVKRAELEGKAQARAYMEAKARAELEEEDKLRADQERKAREIAEILRTKVVADEEKAEEKPVRRVSRRRTNIMMPIAIGLVAVLVVGIALLHVVPLRFVAVKLERSMSGWLHDDVSIGSLKFVAVPTPHFNVENFAVGKQLDARARAAKIYPDIGTVFGDHPLVRSIEMDDVNLTREAVRRIMQWGDPEGRTGTIGTIKVRGVKLDVQPALEPFEGTFTFTPKGMLDRALLSGPGGWSLALKPGGEAGSLDVNFNGRNWTPPLGAPVQFGTLEANGVLTRTQLVIPEFEGVAMDGKVKGSLKATWGSGVRVDSEFSLTRVQAEQLVGAFTKNIAINGRLDASFNVVTEAPTPDALFKAPVAKGRFKISDGSLSNVDLVAVMQSDAAGQRAGVTKFNELSGDYGAGGQTSNFRQVVLQDKFLRASGSVDVGANGALAGRATLEIRSQVTQDRGSFNISGTVSRPIIKRGG